ncbi:GNAT family N-acetyltransferase [Arthrobacter tecti]
MITIEIDSTVQGDVQQLLNEHLTDMFATSPAESVHALDHSALRHPDITFWSAREDLLLLGCGALKRLPHGAGEIKSMRTAEAARGRGVATLILKRIIAEAHERGYERLFLETGTRTSSRRPDACMRGTASCRACPSPATPRTRTAPS